MPAGGGPGLPLRGKISGGCHAGGIFSKMVLQQHGILMVGDDVIDNRQPRNILQQFRAAAVLWADRRRILVTIFISSFVKSHTGKSDKFSAKNCDMDI